MVLDVTKEYTPVTNLAVDQSIALEAIDSGYGFSPMSYQEESRLRQKTRAIDIAALAGKALDEIEEDETKAVYEAKETIGSATQTAIDSQLPLSTIQDTFEKESDIKSYSDFVLEGALSVDDPRYSPAFARLVTNQQIAAEMIQEKFAETLGQGTGATVWDWTDYYIFRHIPFGLLDDLGMRGSREGLENALAQANLAPEEFRQVYSQQLDDLAREGFFTSENYFAVVNEFDRALNAGYDPSAIWGRIFGVAETALIVVPAVRSASVLGRAAATRGVKTSNEVASRIEGTALATEESIMLDTLPKVLDPTAGPDAPRPSLGAISLLKERNPIIQEIQTLTNQGVFGRIATPAQVEQAASQVLKTIEATASRPVADWKPIDLPLNRKAISVDFGTIKDGSPFKKEANAQTLAQSYREKGMVANPVKTTDGWFVRVEEQLDLTRVEGALDISQELDLFRGTVARALGSTALTDNPVMNTLANIGEQANNTVIRVAAPYIRKVDSLPYDSKIAVGQIFKQLRDGEDAGRTVFYTKEEFKQLFKNYHPKGQAPSEQDYEAYGALVSINDASYILQATRIADRFVSRGYKGITFGDKVSAAVPVTDLKAGTKVFDVKTGQSVRAESVREGNTIWKVAVEEEGFPQYVVNPTAVRTLEPSDVLNYNAGGNRVYAEANYFVTLGSGVGRAVMTAFSRKQAAEAVDQLTNIQTTLRQVLKESGKKIDDLTTELDDVILKNNRWNPSVEDTAGLVRLMKEKKWNLDKPISFKATNDVIESEDNLLQGLTYREHLAVSRRRSDDVLMTYGGAEALTNDPVRAIFDSLSNSGYQYSYSAYTQRAKAAWVKKATRSDKIDPLLSVDYLFRNYTPKGVDADRLNQMRNIILRREFFKPKSVQMLESFMQDVTEFVFDKTGKKLGLGDPTNSLLNLGFQSAFGFFNVAQFFLQASHSLAIAAISPQGSKALAYAIPLRLVIHAGGEEAARRFARATGMELTDAKELIQYVKTSGRYDVDMDAAEKLTAPGFGISGFEGESHLPRVVRKGLYTSTKTAKRVLDAGLTPFREGERLSRLTGEIAAILEYKKLYKGASIFTDEARMWITRREHNLTLNMTTGSRGWFQDGLMRLPTQWMSHSLRIMETLTTNRVLSKAERIKLAGFLGLSSGLYGMGLANAADDTADTLGIDPNSNAYVALKYGVIDGLLSWGLSEATDQDVRTAFGTRIAPLAQFTDLYRKVTEENAIAVLGGPSADITSGMLGSLFKSVGNLYNGQPISAGLDLATATRALAGVDNITKAIAIYNYGTYSSRSGNAMPFKDMGSTEAFLQAIGITNFKAADFYQRRTQAFRDARQVKSFTKELVTDYRQALDMFDKGEEQKGLDLMREVEARVLLSGFSPFDQIQIRKQLQADTVLDTYTMALNYMRRGNFFGAEVVEGF